MTPLGRRKPVEVFPGVYQVPALGAKVTLVVKEREVLVVDTGLRGSGGIVASALARLGYRLEDVGLIALTHTHPDHAGAVQSLAAMTGAGIAVHEAESAVIAGHEPAVPPYRLAALNRLTQPAVRRLYGGAAPVAHQLSHGSLLDWREEVMAVHMPGHTAGTTCFYLRERRLLLVGDALTRRFRMLGPPARSVTQDEGEAKQSLRRLLDLEFEGMVFGHYDPLKGGARKELEALVNRLKINAVEQKVS
jgi:glyoxylase-like metal-dependent hydrolase (beta-lactamase superfamily II)